MFISKIAGYYTLLLWYGSIHSTTSRVRRLRHYYESIAGFYASTVLMRCSGICHFSIHHMSKITMSKSYLLSCISLTTPASPFYCCRIFKGIHQSIRHPHSQIRARLASALSRIPFSRLISHSLIMVNQRRFVRPSKVLSDLPLAGVESLTGPISEHGEHNPSKPYLLSLL